MASTLLSGPAGAGKTQEAIRLLSVASVPTVVADFQQIYAAILLQFRNPETGRYDERNPSQSFALATAEYMRLVLLRRAQEDDLDVIATNSDGSPERRRFLLGVLGAGSREQVIDPGYDAIVDRLSVNGLLSQNCSDAVNRWYSRL